ncbi:hypothetical protein VSH64_16110 [Amycolatopsis rhabdoformis]|uniref:SDR family NAD(P)-dependent oxidoreductase n=1 Tax=Amycolatopsis rhabdoformis TaxID=1448059 RepID=A0ABZ1IGU8_9PSEU|nr:hypothetical protein [Amycolatopsis rhabdoformis]WSE33612.1 hypothetical protein VSH64_16110 [Amycolatopsis rhabdoformis]
MTAKDEPDPARDGTVIVTAAASDIGAGIARWVREAGYHVVLLDLDSAGPAPALAEPADPTALAPELSAPDSAARLTEAARTSRGKWDW